MVARDKALSRRDFLKSAGVAASVSMVGCAGESVWPLRERRRPNIIFILADDLGYGDLGCYGQAKIETPHIDRMAAEGMRFTQHYSGSTVCAPSRCCLLTGLHSGHGLIRGNKGTGDENDFPLPAGAVTVSGLLKDAGYKTAVIGKWGQGGPGSTGEPNRQGFDYHFGYLGQVHAHFYYPEYLRRNGQKVVLEGNQNGGKGQYSHDLFTEEALGFIKDNGTVDEPFFLYLPYTIPHAELTVPEDSLSKYKGKFPEKPYPGGHYCRQEMPKATIAGMISRMDGDVGKIMSLLKELGIDDNTIVMFSSDNGPHKEGGAAPEFFKSYGPLRGIKRDLYEGGIRVPLIARWPGRIDAGTVCEHVSAFWDFLPTCTELAGVKDPEGLDGISMVPALMGKDGKQKEHEYLYWEFLERGKARAVRFGNFKAVQKGLEGNPDGPIELYNLATDIAESNDIAAGHPEIIAKVKAYFKAAHVASMDWPFLA